MQGRRRSAVAALALAATSAAGGLWADPGGAAPAVVSGATLTVLEPFASWASGLDPLTNPEAAADASLEDAVFGELFELGPKGRVIDDLAAGSRLSDGGRRFTIDVRRGVTFSDGTPFDATAVAFNLRRDLAADCTCKPAWPGATVSTSGRYQVVVHLTRPDGAVLDQFQGAIVNWMVSPSAFTKASAAAFASAPVGAGPFEVVSDTTSDKLVLERNPHYWERGHPYLKGLVFESTLGDTVSEEDLRSGAAQVEERMTTPGLVARLDSAGFEVTPEPASAVVQVALDTTRAPFDRKPARAAIYYATDAAVLDRVLNGNATPVSQSFTAPGDRFYEPKVPGYRSFDLAKARSLVHKLKGLSFTLDSIPAGPLANVGPALQELYTAAGMKVTLHDGASATWGAAVSAAGSFDPADGAGLAAALPRSRALDALIAKGEATVNNQARARVYATVAATVSRQADGPFLYPIGLWSVAAPGVAGPGLTTNLPAAGFGPQVLWEDVRDHPRH